MEYLQNIFSKIENWELKYISKVIITFLFLDLS